MPVVAIPHNPVMSSHFNHLSQFKNLWEEKNNNTGLGAVGLWLLLALLFNPNPNTK